MEVPWLYLSPVAFKCSHILQELFDCDYKSIHLTQGGIATYPWSNIVDQFCTFYESN